MIDQARATTTPGAQRPSASRWRHTPIAVEVVTLALLIASPAWLALHWRGIPAVSPHFHRPKSGLLAMPALSLLVYLLLGEYGLLSRMDILRSHRLSGFRPIFRAYFLAARLELLAFFTVLSFAMDRTALTGHAWPARGFNTASLTVIFLTILLFISAGIRAAYRLFRPAP